MNRYGLIRFAHVHERVSTKSFVVLIIGNAKSNHLGAQGTFKQRGMPSTTGAACAASGEGFVEEKRRTVPVVPLLL